MEKKRVVLVLITAELTTLQSTYQSILGQSDEDF